MQHIWKMQKNQCPFVPNNMASHAPGTTSHLTFHLTLHRAQHHTQHLPDISPDLLPNLTTTLVLKCKIIITSRLFVVF